MELVQDILVWFGLVFKNKIQIKGYITPPAHITH